MFKFIQKHIKKNQFTDEFVFIELIEVVWGFIFTECDGGNFGQDCSNKCGNCLQNEQCHHINGSCMNGCNPGYYGTYCSKSKSCTHNSKNFQN